MKKLMYISGVLIAVGSLLSTAALSKTANAKKGDSARIATCKADCLPGHVDKKGVGMHGLYRSYSKWDPHLTSPKGKKEYAVCVRTCLAPLPSIYIQRLVFGMGLTWFGQTQQSCFECHTSRAPDRLLPSERGVGHVPLSAGN